MSAYRLAALALAASMLHLNFVRADSICATHADHARRDVSSHQAMSDHHASEHHASSDAQDDASCETPSQPDCCQALASCSVLLGADDGNETASAARGHEAVTSAGANAPLSRLAAPDPPPPKL